jgi:predicted GNAT family acetyltransferase
LNGKLVYFAVFQELHWFFTIKKNVESFVCLQPVNSAHLQGFICRRIFVPELLRGNGIAQNLFVIALQFVKVAIYSDEHQTELASKVWKSLSQRYTVSVVDTATGKLSPYSQSAYTDNPSADKLLIIGPHPPSLIEAHGEFYFIFWNHYTFLTKETNE